MTRLLTICVSCRASGAASCTLYGVRHGATHWQRNAVTDVAPGNDFYAVAVVQPLHVTAHCVSGRLRA